MIRSQSPFFLALVATVGVFHPTEASAQKAGTKWHEDAELGYKFKPLKDWSATPLSSDRTTNGQILTLTADKSENVKLAGNRRVPIYFSLSAFQLNQPSATTKGSGGGLRERVQEKTKRPTLEEVIPNFFQVRDFN